MKRYYYKGKEISEFKANLIFVGSIAGLFATAAIIFLGMQILLYIGTILEGGSI